MFLDYSLWDEHLFYEKLEQYIGGELGLKDFTVFSYPPNYDQKSEKKIIETLRSIWNREELLKWQEEGKLEMRLKAYEKKGTKELTSYFENSDDSRDIFLLFTEDEEQKRVAVIRDEKCREKTIEVLEHVVHIVRSHHKTRLQIKQLEKVGSLIYADDVTNLYNQRKLVLDVNEAITRHEKYGENFSVLFIDIDHFKNVNDGHGHLIGTLLLKEVAHILQRVLRESDLIYRYGGDEFVMVVPKADSVVARRIGERVLKSVKNHSFRIKDHEPFKLSVSIGIAEFPKDAYSSEEILAMADNMMYKAKSNGRGQVCMADEFYK